MEKSSPTYTNNKVKIFNHFDRLAPMYARYIQSWPLSLIRYKEQCILKNLIKKCKQGIALEIGAGTGLYGKIYLTEHVGQLESLDISQNMLNQLTYPTNKIKADFETYNFDEKKYDSIICIGVLEFFQLPMEAIVKMSKLIKPEGTILLYFPTNSLPGCLYKLIHKMKNIQIKLFSIKDINFILDKTDLKLMDQQLIWNFSKALLLVKK